jgi:hypothetical protein
MFARNVNMAFRIWVSGIGALAVALSGCATPNEGRPNAAAQNAGNGPAACMQINADNIDTNYGGTVAEGAAIWGLVGAAVGALAGAATGGGRGAATGAAIGAGAGGAYGAVSGVQTAEAKKRYAVQEAQLDCQIAAAKADNEKLAKLVTSMQAAVQQTEKKLADLESAYANKRMSKEQAQKELASVDESAAQIKRSVDAMKKRRDEYLQARDSTQNAANNSLNTAELDKQISDLNKQIASAQSDLDRLMARRKVAQVG